MGHSARRVRWLAYGAVAASIAAGSASPGVAVAKGSTWAGRPSSVSHLAATRRVVVQAKAGRAAAAAAAVRAAGGTVDEALPIVNGFAAHVPAGALAALRANAAVKAVSDDSDVTFATVSYDSTVASNFARTTGATSSWAAGRLGDGVGVAVIDTGVSDMNDFGGRLVHGPDLSGEFSAVDSFGHGTVMAGLIGGSGADSESNAGGAYVGVAPHAKVVAVKAAGRNGATDVSTMLQAMHWVAAYKNQYNIRVLNLSWGTMSTADPASDPLNYAVQRLWKLGIVVVVSAGNAGPGNGTITKPGDDPVVVTVGAYDDKGNASTADDSIPSWSSRGPTAQGISKPDVVAPGRTLVATRSYGSAAEVENPGALVAPSYIKGSGTSEAAAVTSGLAALIVQAHPEWTPDKVKKALRSSAVPMDGVPSRQQGQGRVSLAGAIAATPGNGATQATPATGLGSIEASRGPVHVYSDCQGDGTMDFIQGEIDVFCNAWDGNAWGGNAWSGNVWTGATWPDQSWTGASWGGNAWSGGTWGGASWGGNAWGGNSWGGASWGGNSWGGASWGGNAWGGASWGGNSWGGASWGGNAWGGNAWGSMEYGDGFQTAFWGSRPRFDKHVNGEVSAPHGARTRADD